MLGKGIELETKLNKKAHVLSLNANQDPNTKWIGVQKARVNPVRLEPKRF